MAQLPQFERAQIPAEKLRDYLLSPSHPVGRFKAAFFAALGYSQERWTVLEADIRTQILPSDAQKLGSTPFGDKYSIAADLRGPTGRSVRVVSIWIVPDS